MLEQSRFKKAVQTRHTVLHVCNPTLEKLGEWIIHEFEAILGYTKFRSIWSIQANHVSKQINKNVQYDTLLGLDVSLILFFKNNHSKLIERQ